jgi:hypothetical protein
MRPATWPRSASFSLNVGLFPQQFLNGYPAQFCGLFLNLQCAFDGLVCCLLCHLTSLVRMSIEKPEWMLTGDSEVGVRMLGLRLFEKQ